MNETRTNELTALCAQNRRELIRLLHSIQTGHPGGSLSCCEIVTTLYHELMRIDPANPKWEDRDRFVLSKGHAAPMLYLNLAARGYFPKQELASLRQLNSSLQGHPCAHKTPGVELSTGPLGLGLSAAVGMALSARLDGRDFYTYVLLGDGEIQEGCVWEAAMSAAKFKTSRVIAILDHNGVQLDGTVARIMPLDDPGAPFAAFGWNVLHCDGHDVAAFAQAVEQAKNEPRRPSLIVAQTVKGKGVSFMEGKNTWHGKPISDEEYRQAISELGGAQ